MKKRILNTILSIVLMLALLQATNFTVLAADFDDILEGGIGFHYGNSGFLDITIPETENYYTYGTASGNSAAQSAVNESTLPESGWQWAVKKTSDGCTLILNEFHVTYSSNGWGDGILFKCKLNVELHGDNSFIGTNGNSLLSATSGNDLTISGDGSLTLSGGRFGINLGAVDNIYITGETKVTICADWYAVRMGNINLGTGVSAKVSSNSDGSNAMPFEYNAIYKWFQSTYSEQTIPTHAEHPICGTACDCALEHTVISEWIPIDDASDFGNLMSGKSYYLANDIESANTIKIDSEINVNICLNGKVLKYTGSNGYVIDVSGTLNLTDCQTATHYFADGDSDGCWELADSAATDVMVSGGAITGGNRNDGSWSHAAGVDVHGLFNMYAGNIVGNKGNGSAGGGGVYVRSGYTFNMYGGSICGNAGPWGGGVLVFGTFSMNSGIITENTATQDGGGVYIKDSNSSTAVLNGGSITNNKAGAFGGGIFDGKNLTLSGNIVISGNTATTGKNLYINKSSATGIVVTGLSTDTKIGVSTSDTTYDHYSFTEAANKDYSIYFESEDTNYMISNSGSGDVQVVQLTNGNYKVNVENDGNGEALASQTTATIGTEITLTATPKSGYHFKEWLVKEGGVTISGNKFTMPAANVTVKAVFEVDVITHTVTFMDENGVYLTTNVKNGEKVTMPEVPKKDGYTVTWDKILDTVTSDVIVNAVYTKIQEPDTPVDTWVPETDESIDTGNQEAEKPGSPKTGETATIWMWLALLCISSGAVITLTVHYKNRKTTGI